MSIASPAITFAVPKGRILDELMPVMKRAGIIPEAAFDDEKSRKLVFDTNVPNFRIIRVRSFDAATFVAFGAAQMGVAGNDVLMEFDYDDVYAPLDLGIGACRLSLCQPAHAHAIDTRRMSHLRVATKFPNFTRRYFAERGVQAECIELNGAMELAPLLNLAPAMVDLVATGSTLKANNLVEREVMAHVTSRLIISRSAYKTETEALKGWIERFRKALAA